MKSIVCEKCGNVGLEKRGDYYMCITCGQKFAIEETITPIDRISQKTIASNCRLMPSSPELVDNYLAQARQALSCGDYDRAAFFYENAAFYLKDDWESNFYFFYCRAFEYSLRKFTIGEKEDYVRELIKQVTYVSNIFPSTLQAIRDTLCDEGEQKNAYSEVAMRITKLLKISSSRIDRYNHGYSHPLLYEMEYKLATCLWKIFQDHDLAMEHLLACNSNSSKVGRNRILNLMVQIDPKSVRDEREKCMIKKKKSNKATCVFCFLFAICLTLALIGGLLDIVPLLAIGALLGVIFLICTIPAYIDSRENRYYIKEIDNVIQASGTPGN